MPFSFSPPLLRLISPEPGEMLMWVIEGYDNEDPDQLARLLGELLEDYYISTEEEERITVDRRRYERLPRCVRRRLVNGS